MRKLRFQKHRPNRPDRVAALWGSATVSLLDR